MIAAIIIAIVTSLFIWLSGMLGHRVPCDTLLKEGIKSVMEN
jgi:hypothetical protein